MPIYSVNVACSGAGILAINVCDVRRPLPLAPPEYLIWSDTQLYYFFFTANMIQATSPWAYVANTKFLLNKSTPYHALNNYLMLLMKGLIVYYMISIENNNEIKNILGDSWARLTATVWNCPGLDRVRGLMSVLELPSNECSKSSLKYCSVKWSSQTIFRLKRSTLWPVSMNHRSNSVKPFNWQFAFRREFRGICYLEELFSHLMHLL